METIFIHRLEIYKKPTKFLFSRDSFTVREEPILAQNEKYIVLNDYYFTKIEKKSASPVWGVLNKEVVSFQSCIGEKGVFYSCYSENKKTVPSIKKAIHKKAEKEYGWLFSSELDLSILSKEGAE